MEWTSNQIRQTFLDFFRGKQHEIVPSAPIVVKDDPTLMFTNAGMNQFKGIFLGNIDAEFKRIADSQKCLRVSGKHNDLEEVGRDHYHHTMFEMLGNWSFGDYFKEEAIAWAWELLTDVYKLDKNRIYVSFFQGDEQQGLARDEEALRIWRKYIDEDRILPFGRKENFWEMGETGPCGPCSEIHFDLRSEAERKAVDGSTLVNADHPSVIEIWNLVFIQFNRMEDASLVNLREKHIDTGMGLERLARVLQKTDSNYDIDLFKGLIEEVEKATGKSYKGSDSLADVAFRVIADHVRAVSFCIADGQLPSNTGAGYVIRRILRRAIRYGFSQLEMKEPFIYQIAGRLVDIMGGHYPELVQNRELVSRVIQEEERSFLLTLEKGLEKIGNYLKQNVNMPVSGEFAFELYDTFGFPIDLTHLIAAEHEVEVDMEAFEQELNKQKERSRQASRAEFGDWVILEEGPNSEFVGYDLLKTETRVMKYRKAKVKGRDTYQMVLERTPFYAESGGQVGDQGTLIFTSGEVRVLDTKRENNEIIHLVSGIPSSVDDPTVIAEVDSQRRKNIQKNHSATHLLHYVLRDELGKHVEQRGSLVAPDRLRFDFSHFERIPEETLERIGSRVSALITADQPLEEWRGMPIQEAKAMGAMALFGEKYGNNVRVVKFGNSVELCGGTHVARTADIEGLIIVSEGSVASGIRRVEALTGEAYHQYINERLGVLKNLEEKLGGPKDVLQAVEKLQAELKDLQHQIEGYRQAEQRNIERTLLKNIKEEKGYRLINYRVDGVEGKVLKDVAFNIIGKDDDIVLITGGVHHDKVSVVIGISKGLADRQKWDASGIIREISPTIDGGGGGQKFLAIAGGKNKQGLDQALVLADEIIRIQAS